MIEDNLPQEKKVPSKWNVVGYNLVALVIYTVICRFIDGGMFLDAFILAFHFFACIITAIILKKWEWVLSAFVVIAIGFSTCVAFLSINNMH